jgi:hypothetical protein
MRASPSVVAASIRTKAVVLHFEMRFRFLSAGFVAMMCIELSVVIRARIEM